MSRSARAIRTVTATSSATIVLGLLLIAMPLISLHESQLEWWIDVGAGAAFVVLGAFDLLAVLRGSVETMVWRSVVPAVVGVGLAATPMLGSSSYLYLAATVAAGLAGLALSVIGGWFSATIPLPLPRAPPHA